LIEVTYYNMSVALTTDIQNLLDRIEKFIDVFYTVKGSSHTGSNQPVLDKRFVGKIKNQNTYVFHTNQFLHLYEFLTMSGYTLTDVVKHDCRDYQIDLENYIVKDGWKLTEKQEPMVEFLTQNPSKSRLLGLQTGGGKTVVSLFSLAKIGWRTAIVILPQYIDKWCGDIPNVHKAGVKDLMVIQGSKALRGIASLAKEKEYFGRYIIFSSRTLQEFISQFEENPEHCQQIYGITPIELMPLLGIGTMLVDESHQHFHAIFKILIYSNVKYELGLSATLLTDDPVVRRVHSVVYPKSQIYDTGELVKYTDVYALSYYVPEHLIRKVKTTNYGSNSYSHTAFEQSLWRDRGLKEFHLRLWCNALDDFFVDQYQLKDTCMIFVGTVKWATFLTEFIKHRYPQFTTNRYCEDDPFTNLEEADIVVTTIISAGTAVDKANLRTVIQTVSVSSTVANVQNLGRLRQLKDGKDTRFVYIYASNIRKQVAYHHKRLDLFRARVKTHSSRRARV
jgi:superfamily II DNA or RNA helicase